MYPPRRPHHQAAALLLSLWATSTTAISLSNFTPHIDNLPSACNAVYTQTIPGCTAADFTTNTQCSKACVSGLVQISAAITSQCADADVAETSIVGVFLLGQGIPALCNNIQVTTIPASTQPKSTTAAAPPPSSSASPDPPSLAPPAGSSAGIIMDTASPPIMRSTTLLVSTIPPSAASSTPAVSSAPITPHQSPADPAHTSASFSLASASASATASASAAATKSSALQKSNPNSGGGSPFDVQAVGNAAVGGRGGGSGWFAVLGAVVVVGGLAVV